MRGRACGLLLALLAGCAPLVPASVPPQLAHTPGAFVQVGQDAIITQGYRLAYPLGWRVVKLSEANQPASFVVVSPDEALQIAISPQPHAAITPSEGTIIQEETRTLPSGPLYVRLLAPLERQAEAEAHLSRLLNSLRAP